MSAICRRRRNWIWIGRGDAGDDVKGKIYIVSGKEKRIPYTPLADDDVCAVDRSVTRTRITQE